MAAFSSKGRWPQISVIFFLTFLTAIALIPFINKAFHMDDPLFIWSARYIQSHPADPYGFKVTWYFKSMDLWEILKNPPLTSYFIALAAHVVGWSEAALHSVFILPAIAVILGTYFMARRFCSRPVTAALLTLSTPVFLVSSTTVMCDVMMLAFWVWAILSWVRGLEKGDHALLIASSFLVACSALTKYYGASLVILLSVYTLTVKRDSGTCLAYLLIPLVILAIYQWKMQAMYGQDPLAGAASYASGFQSRLGLGLPAKLGMSLAFTGGCLATMLFFLPLLWSRRALIAQAVFFALMMLVVSSVGRIGKFALPDAAGLKWGILIQFSLFALIGINVLALSISEAWKGRREAASLLLFLWIAGTFIFAGFINWTVNGRSILPMAPAMALVLVRALERRGAWSDKKFRRYLSLPLAGAFLFSMVAGWADYALADAGRRAAAIISSGHEARSGRLFFEGHWGFQYYMESKGFRPLEKGSSDLRTGDILVIPENNCYLFPLPSGIIFEVRSVLELAPGRWMTTMDRSLGAGFYADKWGPLPFAIGKVPPEIYDILIIKNDREG